VEFSKPTPKLLEFRWYLAEHRATPMQKVLWQCKCIGMLWG